MVIQKLEAAGPNGIGPIAGKLRKMILGAFVLALTAVTLSFPASSQAGTLDQIKASGELRVAGLVYVPFIIRNPDGTYEGIDPDLLAQLASELGAKLRFVDAGWDTAIAGLTTNKWDIVPSLCIRPERAKVIDFSEPYFVSGNVLTVLKDSPITSVEQANDAGVTFAAATGSAAQTVIPDLFPNAKVKLFPQASIPELVQELLSKRVDAILSDTPILVQSLQTRYGDQFRFLPSATEPLAGKNCPAGYGYRKGDDAFGAAVNAFLTKIKSSGEFDALKAKWMTEENMKKQ